MAIKGESAPPRGLWEREPGSGVWWIRYRDADGKLHREKVGRKSDAEALLNKRRNDCRVGKKMPENIRTAPIKFDKLANYITEEYSKAHHSDSRNVKQRLDKLKEHFGARAAESIKPAEIDNWLSKNTKTGSTANRYRAAMSLAYREGIRNGKVKSNPVRLVKQRKEGGNVIRFLRDHEEAALRAVIAQKYPDKMYELDISLGTGMRLSEQYGSRLRWQNVDFQRREVDLSKTKNYTARVIPMNASVFAAFEARKAQVPHAKSKDIVFDTPPRPWWDDVREQAGVTDYRWHDNRHTFCSRLAMRKVNLVAIKELAGHKTLAITARYAHLDDDAKREAVDSLLIPASGKGQIPPHN
jgi:site-specific recombinase XerD